MVFKEDGDTSVVAQVGTIECVLRIGIVAPLYKYIGLFDNPFCIHARVVGNHVACKTDAPLPQSCTQICQRIPAAQIVGNFIIKEGVGTCRGFGVSANLLDSLACVTSLPKTDEPKPGKSLVAQHVQFLIGNLVKAGNVAVVFF